MFEDGKSLCQLNGLFVNGQISYKNLSVVLKWIAQLRNLGLALKITTLVSGRHCINLLIFRINHFVFIKIWDFVIMLPPGIPKKNILSDLAWNLRGFLSHPIKWFFSDLRLFTVGETSLWNQSHLKTNSAKTILFCYKCFHWEPSSPP